MKNYLEKLRALSLEKQKNNFPEIVAKQIEIVAKIIEEEVIAESIVSKILDQLSQSEYLKKGLTYHQKRHNVDVHAGELARSQIEKVKDLLHDFGSLLNSKVSKPKRELEIIDKLERFITAARISEQKLKGYAEKLSEQTYDKRVMRFVSLAGKGLGKALLVRAEGLENIPHIGPCLIASRHYHALYDYPILCSIIPRNLFALSGSENFLNPLKRWFMTKIGAHPVKNIKPGQETRHSPETIEAINNYPTNNGVQIRKLIWHLQNGDCAVVFPEGKAIKVPFMPKLTRKFSEPKDGTIVIAYLAQKKIGKPLPIIPVGLNYGEVVRVKIGKPFYLKPLPKKKSREHYTAESKRLFAEIKKLSK